jgi:hypothetical protein
MKRPLPLSALLLLACLTPAEAGAVMLRHPLGTNPKSVNYGVDHGGKDYNCGSKYYSTHTGNDYSLPTGNQVVAAASGTVAQVIQGCADVGSLGNTCGGKCGNYVRITHSDGMQTLYCHMKNGSISVSVGQAVSCGQPIGLTASSGSSTGPHLHLALRTSGGTTIDPYAGPCAGSTSYWVAQNGYTEGPGTGCACTPSAEVCDGADNNCDGQIDEGGVCCTPSDEVCDGKDNDCDGTVDEDEVCEQQLAVQAPVLYAAPSTTDLDGDGRADVCGRGGSGILCHLATPEGFGAEQLLVPLSNDTGWTDPSKFATMRMGDVDGDGKADLCVRGDAGIRCYTSAETPLGTAIDGPPWSDDQGWGATRFYSTIRLADIDGDGKEDLCARAAAGLRCHRATGAGFEAESIAGPPWSDENGLGAARYYTTLRMGDVDGDGKADACIRNAKGVECVLSDGAGFPTVVEGPAWSDESGWGSPLYHGSIRLADVNGDGKADLCARGAANLQCHFSEGTAFGPAVDVAPLADAQGWDDPSNYLTLRTGDVDGDGAADLCLRANAGMRCYRWDSESAAFATIEGPGWADENGWASAQHFHTVRLGDWNGDRKADLCARAAAGWLCAPSNGEGFDAPVQSDAYSNDKGWGAEPYWPTLLFASPACRKKFEECNGEDDDCDGLVDEDGVCDQGGIGGEGGEEQGGAAGSDTAGASSSSGAMGGTGATGGKGGAAGRGGKNGVVLEPGGPEQEAGCQCRQGVGQGSGGGAAALLALLTLCRRRSPSRR